MLSIVAAQHKVPFFVAAPVTTLDPGEISKEWIEVNTHYSCGSVLVLEAVGIIVTACSLVFFHDLSFVSQPLLPLLLTALPCGSHIVIEGRPSEELTHFRGTRVVDERVQVRFQFLSYSVCVWLRL